MIYRYLITAALLAVWGTTAYMSVCGLLAVFGGNAVATITLAAGLELAKLMVIVHLHRCWRRLRPVARLFYALVVAALAMVTAIEAAGYLIQSNSAVLSSVTISESRLAGLTAEEQIVRQRIGVIDDTVEQLPAGYVSRRIAERAAAGYDTLHERLAEIIAERRELDAALIGARLQAGPIATAAATLDVDAGRLLRLFVLLLVSIIEPLTIGLAVAASTAWSKTAGGQALKKPVAETAWPQAQNSNLPDRPSETAFSAAETQPDIITNNNDPASISAEQKEFLAIVAAHNLTAEKVAEIADRQKVETARGWLSCETEIPIKSLRLLRRWAQIRALADTPEQIEFLEIVQRHKLDEIKIGKITGRSKNSTVNNWLTCEKQIPIKSLRMLRAWAESQPHLSIVGR